MNINRVKIENEAHWHSLRANRIGASEMGALFNAHEHIGKWQLYRMKRKEWEMKKTDAMMAGQFLEEGVARYVSHKLGVELIKCTDYFYIDGAPIGCTPDYFNPATGEYVQIKVARRTWEDLPLYVELQAQVEMMCTNTTSHTTYVLNPFFEIVEFKRTFMIDRVRIMCDRAIGFMYDVERGEEPEMDDGSAHMAGDYYRGRDIPDNSINKIGDTEFEKIIAGYNDAAEKEKDASEKREIYRARLLNSLDTAQYAVFTGGRVSAKTDSRGARRINIKMEKQND